jgi:hypothetical protein
MAKVKGKEFRKLTRIGKRSIGLTLPIELVRSLGWREKQNVVVKKSGGALVIRDAKSKKK